jgi:hypothetical protein
MKLVLPVFLFLLILFVPSAYAQEELEIDAISVTPPSEVQYTLPFPGILPSNPLYPLKATRDRVVSFFISDPVKKAEFDLLQADKRLQAGLFLLSEENPDHALAISTISKGQNYFEEALVAAGKLKQTKEEAGDLPNRLHTAALKHHEVLTKAARSIPEEKKKEFSLLLKRSAGFVSSAKQLRREK